MNGTAQSSEGARTPALHYEHQIPWLRVFVEGVVIVGCSFVLLAIVGCQEDSTTINLCDSDYFDPICDPPPPSTPPPVSWVTGTVYLGDSPLTGLEGQVQMFVDSTASLAYDALVDTANGLFGRNMLQQDVCAGMMFSKGRYRVAPDSMWHDSPFQALVLVLPSPCPDTIRVSDIVIPVP